MLFKPSKNYFLICNYKHQTVWFLHCSQSEIQDTVKVGHRPGNIREHDLARDLWVFNGLCFGLLRICLKHEDFMEISGRKVVC